MAAKTDIVSELGEKELLLPNLVNAALSANERAKYFMTLLQTAREHAEHPEAAVASLKRERLASGVPDREWDSVVEGSRSLEPGTYCVPRACAIQQAIVESIRQMIAPLEAAEVNGRAAGYAQRLERVVAECTREDQDRITADEIDRITAGERSARDSLHVLVMDLHRELNQLQQRISSELIGGAYVYGIQEGDRPLIGAFMSGVDETAKLKFGHPGLGTTATRAGGKLVIQNDIGTTDAHVLVVHVEPPTATVICTDVHLQRLMFFQQMFRDFDVEWEDTRSKRSSQKDAEMYHLSLGTFRAEDDADLRRYLRFLGSRLVFLIDWNRARKRLRKLAPKRVALEVLQWAAQKNCGHMAFLKLGGEHLIFDALQLAAATPLQVGGQLSDLLGRNRVADFLRFTLKTAAEGLLAERSERLIRDEIRAELRHYLETVHQGLLEIAAEHASLIVELAMAARDCLLLGEAKDRDYLLRVAVRAKKWEHLADQLVTKARSIGEHRHDGREVFELLRVADDVADDLEESIFLLTLLMPDSLHDQSLASLQELTGLLVQGAQEYLKAVADARHLNRSSPREQVVDFLEAVDRTMAIEHETDDAHRRAKGGVPAFSGDFRQLHLFVELCDNLEEAADALMRSSFMLRDYVLGQVITQ